MNNNPDKPIQNDETILSDLTRRMGEAEKNRDADFFSTLLTEKLTFRRASGIVSDKATFLKDLLNSANTYERLESDDVSVAVYEGVAVVTLLVRAKGTREGKPFGGVYRNIRIHVLESDKQPAWQLHNWFNIRIGDL